MTRLLILGAALLGFSPNQAVAKDSRGAFEQALQLNDDFLHGKVTLANYNKKLGELKLLGKILPSLQVESATKAAHFAALMNFEGKLFLKRVAGVDFHPTEVAGLKALKKNPAKVKADIDLQVAPFQIFYRYLKNKYSIRFDQDGTWHLENWIGKKFSIAKIRGDKQLHTALALFFSPQIAHEFIDWDRKETLILGNVAIMPPKKLGPGNAEFEVRPLTQYQKQFTHLMKMYDESLKEFQKNAIEASSYSDYLSGRMPWNREARHNGRTSAEIRRDDAYDSLITYRALMKKLGVSRKLNTALLQVENEIHALEGRLSAASFKQINLAWWAIPASAGVFVALYFAPVAVATLSGTSVSTALAATVGSISYTGVAGAGQMAVAMLALFPSMYSTVSSVGRAAIHSYYTGADFGKTTTLNLHESLPQSLLMGSATAFIPFVGFGAGSVITATTGNVAFAMGGKAVIDLSIAGYFAKTAISVGWSGLALCSKNIEKIRAMDSSKIPQKIVNETLSQAYQQCLEGGLDFAFALQMSYSMTKSGVGFWKSRVGAKNASGSEVSALELEQALDVMGLKKNFTPEQFKARYRELARKWHPDVNGGDPAAVVRMSQINHAKSVLTQWLEAQGPRLANNGSSGNDKNSGKPNEARKNSDQPALPGKDGNSGSGTPTSAVLTSVEVKKLSSADQTALKVLSQNGGSSADPYLKSIVNSLGNVPSAQGKWFGPGLSNGCFSRLTPQAKQTALRILEAGAPFVNSKAAYIQKTSEILRSEGFALETSKANIVRLCMVPCEITAPVACAR